MPFKCNEPAVPTIQKDDDAVRITRWDFAPGAATGWHTHGWPYFVVMLTDAVMRIEGFSYIPNQFTVKQGIPVEWRIDASEAAGCGRILIAPALGVRRLLSGNSTTMISFIPQSAGEFGFNCGMGMMTPGSKFTVVPNGRG